MVKGRHREKVSKVEVIKYVHDTIEETGICTGEPLNRIESGVSGPVTRHDKVSN